MPPCACSAPSSSTACRRSSSTRSTRRPLQAHGGQPAALAVARPGGSARRRLRAHRVSRPTGSAWRTAVDRGQARSLGDHPPCGREPGPPAPTVCGARVLPRRSEAGGRAARPCSRRPSADSARSGTARTVGARHPRRPRCRLRRRRAIRRVRGSRSSAERPEATSWPRRSSPGEDRGADGDEHGRFPVSATASTRSNRRSRSFGRSSVSKLGWRPLRRRAQPRRRHPWRWTRKGLRSPAA